MWSQAHARRKGGVLPGRRRRRHLFIHSAGTLLLLAAWAARVSAADLDPERFRAHLEALTSRPHRMAGTPEGIEAGNYIEAELRKLPGELRIQRFSTPQEIVARCELISQGQTVALLPLAANGMQPSVTAREGLAGPVVYVGSQRFAVSDVRDWDGLFRKIVAQAGAEAPSPGKQAWRFLDDELKQDLQRASNSGAAPDGRLKKRFAVAVDQSLLVAKDFPAAVAWDGIALRQETSQLLRKREFGLDRPESIRLNRLLLEDAFPSEIARGADGKDLQGCIAVADFQDTASFSELFRLGAAAVIYVGSDRDDCGDRDERVPSGKITHTLASADLPRFYISEQAANRFGLLTTDRATLVSQIAWEKRTARNVFLWIPGSRPAFASGREEFTVLSAYYDSAGVVPGNAPSQEEAANCAALLEIAGRLARQPPRRSTLVAFFDAHANFVEGGRQFYSAYRRCLPEHVDDPLPERRRYVEEERQMLQDMTAFLDETDVFARAHPLKDRALKQLGDEVKFQYNVCMGKLSDLRLQTHHLNTELKELRAANGRPNGPAMNGAETQAADIERSLEATAREIEAVNAVRQDWQIVREAIRDRKPVPASEAGAARALQTAIANATGRFRNRITELDEKAMELDDATQVTAFLTNADPVCHVSFRFTAGSDRWLFLPQGVVQNIRFYGSLLDGAASRRDGGKATLPGFVWESRQTWESANASPAVYLGWNSVEECALADVFDIPAMTLATASDPALNHNMPDVRLPEAKLDTIRKSASAFLPLLDSFANGEWVTVRNQVTARRPFIIEDYTWNGTEVAGHMVKRFDFGDTEASAAVPNALVHVMEMRMSSDYMTFADGNGCFPLMSVFRRVRGPALYSDWNSMQIEAAKFDSDGKIAMITTAVPNGPPASVESRWHKAGEYGSKWRMGHYSILTMFEGTHGYLLGRTRLLQGPFNPRWPEQPNGFRIMQGLSNSNFERLHFRFDSVAGVGVYFVQRPMGVKVIYQDSKDPDDVLLFLNSTPGHSTGIGYGPGNGQYEGNAPLRLDLKLAMAGDMVALNESRLQRLRSKNIVMNFAEHIHSRARNMLALVESATAGLRHQDDVTWSTRIALLERRAYRPIIDTTDDMVKAVTVLLLLAVPFAFSLQSLLMPTYNVYRKILGFTVFFMLSFGLLYFTHPAFAFSATPIVIILAFIIMLLSGTVIWIISDRFGYEIKKLQGLAAASHTMEQRVIGNVGAAVSTAISIMQRRPARTALTVVTVLLLTFTILSFAAFQTESGVNTFPKGPADDEVSRLMVRRAVWKSMTGDVETWQRYLASDREGRWQAHGRYWLTRELSVEKDNEELVIPVHHENGSNATAGALMSLDEIELQNNPDIRGMITAEDRDLTQFYAGLGVFLSQSMARELGAKTGDRLNVKGVSVRMLGTFDSAKLVHLREIDGSPLAPVNFSNTRMAIGAVQISGSAAGGQDELGDIEEELAQLEPEALEPANPDTIIVASSALAGHLGMALKAVMVYPATDGQDLDKLARQLAIANRDGVYVNQGGERKLLYYGEQPELTGSSEVAIPLILGGLIIFSTLLGSIIDREKEIYTFSALGLAPRNIAMLFFVEASIYAVVGGFGGYLLSQVVVRGLEILSTYGIFRAPEMNYSSSTVIHTIVLVMATVVVSAAYPAIKAARKATADTMARWRIPQPQGNTLVFDFPFTISRYDITGIVCFIREHFANHADRTVGAFAADEVQARREPQHGMAALAAKIWLQPFDQGISQRFELTARPSDIEEVCDVTVRLERLSGPPAAWQRVYKVFLTDLRAQFLLWRTLNDDVREHYLALADELEVKWGGSGGADHGKRPANAEIANGQSHTERKKHE